MRKALRMLAAPGSSWGGCFLRAWYYFAFSFRFGRRRILAGGGQQG